MALSSSCTLPYQTNPQYHQRSQIAQGPCSPRGAQSRYTTLHMPHSTTPCYTTLLKLSCYLPTLRYAHPQSTLLPQPNYTHPLFSVLTPQHRALTTNHYPTLPHGLIAHNLKSNWFCSPSHPRRANLFSPSRLIEPATWVNSATLTCAGLNLILTPQPTHNHFPLTNSRTISDFPLLILLNLLNPA